MKKTALICGISGQDGAYLAKLLLEKGYRVVGASRDADTCSRSNLQRLGIENEAQLVSMRLSEFRSVLECLDRFEPDEIYNLAGQSSVGLSFQQPMETLQSIAHGSLNLLEAARFLKLHARIYNASSGDCFGDLGGTPANESTAFNPKSPYGVAKSTAHWQVVNYREAYGLFASNGILFNHESPLRPERFVTRKIARGAALIKAGKARELRLGNLAIRRDWGWAPEYVEGMWRILQAPSAADFVLATGHSMTLEDFCARAFGVFDLDWTEHVVVDEALTRPVDIRESLGDPTKAAEELGWRAELRGEEVVRRLVEAEAESLGLD